MSVQNFNLSDYQAELSNGYKNRCVLTYLELDRKMITKLLYLKERNDGEKNEFKTKCVFHKKYIIIAAVKPD